MGILLCKPGDGVWLTDDAGEYKSRLPCGYEWPCAPCVSPGCAAVCCQKARECLCVERKTSRMLCSMPCAPGICEMLFSFCGRYLYQLSAEADCVHTCGVAAGELLYAAPAGVFPRSVRIDETGRYLLCAGGAENKAILFSAPDLLQEQTLRTPHPCFAADFWQDGLVILCAEEGEDIQTGVYTLAAKAIRMRKLTQLPGPPGLLRMCPDGKTALVSTRAGLSKLDLYTGGMIWNVPEWALGMRAECRGNGALLSDLPDGNVWLFNHHRPWERQLVAQAADSQACFL